jgi:hypothetical protein
MFRGVEVALLGHIFVKVCIDRPGVIIFPCTDPRLRQERSSSMHRGSMHASSDASLGTRDDLTAVTVTGEENSVPLDCIRCGFSDL